MIPKILAEVGRAVASRYKVLAGIGIVVAFLAVVIGVPKLSFIQPRGKLTPAERATAESDLRGQLLQALGGLVLVAGAYFTGRTFALNREGQITERFTRAVEQLANDEKLDIRLGGIYALERIARDSETHYEPVMEVLTAFLRQHARWRPESDDRVVESVPLLAPPPPTGVAPGEQSPQLTELRLVGELRADFQAVATVLGRRDRRHERPFYGLVLREVDLRNANLNGAHLERAYLNGAHLEGAHFYRAHLEGAHLVKAHLERAHLNLAHLEGADLTGATGLTRWQLDSAITGRGATLPEYLRGEVGE